MWVVSCSKEGSPQATQGKASAKAVVGQAEILSRDLGYRLRVEQSYGNTSITDEAALVSLIQDALQFEVGRGVGAVATAEDIHALEKHAQENSRAPEILRKAREVFGDDISSYERLYLVPKITGPKLRSYYSRAPELHRTERAAIEKAYVRVVEGISLKQAAEEYGLEYSPPMDRNGNAKEQSLPMALMPYVSPEKAKGKTPLEALVEKLSAGELYQGIVEDDTSYLIIKLVSAVNEKRLTESVVARKHPFEEWLREKADTIEIRIVDQTLADRVRLAFPQLWWVKKWLSTEKR
jgi:hypothetical protein